ncbi:MAG: TetR/AcrR family transcriptional regulator [Burkholderiales bacterium]
MPRRAASASPPPGPRERMVEATITLMRRSGLSGAGINEIVRESGAPKGSVYHFFPDGKRQIAAEALERNGRRVLDFIEAALASRPTPEGGVKALFEAFARRLEEGRFRSSCAAGTVCLDLEEDLEGLREAIAGSFSEWIDAIAGRLAFRDARRARSFAGLVVSAIEGAYIRGRAERSGKAFREAGAWLADVAAREAKA